MFLKLLNKTDFILWNSDYSELHSVVSLQLHELHKDCPFDQCSYSILL